MKRSSVRSITTPSTPIASGESTSISQYGRPRYEKPIHVSTAPSMNSAPCAKLMTLSSPKMTARPRLNIA